MITTMRSYQIKAIIVPVQKRVLFDCRATSRINNIESWSWKQIAEFMIEPLIFLP